MIPLYYCDTTYLSEPPTDISPLILQKHTGQPILVMCARQGMVQRINALPESSLYRCEVEAVGWWELTDRTLGDLIDNLHNYYAAVIVSRDRINEQFYDKLKRFEQEFLESRHFLSMFASQAN